jgi:hypothetical protein
MVMEMPYVRHISKEAFCLFFKVIGEAGDQITRYLRLIVKPGYDTQGYIPSKCAIRLFPGDYSDIYIIVRQSG